VNSTPLEFIEDAISLSGLTGTKLKCDVIGEYYPFWWRITSGGRGRRHRFETAIVELNAATGEAYIKDEDITVLGSAGHALRLKQKTENTDFLKVVLIEEHDGCYARLKKVIKRRWPSIPIDEAEGSISLNTSNIFLIHSSLDEALDKIREIDLGNSIFFFDPLLSVPFSSIEKVAKERIDFFYRTGTEFIIFIFTSDWFLGRKLNDEEFAPLPRTIDEASWSTDERKTVIEADTLFGNNEWRNHVLNDKPNEEREKLLIDLYRDRLHKWFRYVLPLPFNPKGNQVFHIFLCSNFEDGVKRTKDHYSDLTGNPRYTPNNQRAYRRFSKLHPDLLEHLRKGRKPLEWRVLWSIITKHEEGMCDCRCWDLLRIDDDANNIQHFLDWLEANDYLLEIKIENAWNSNIKQYVLNWDVLKKRLDIDRPIPLKPLSPKEMKNDVSNG
jgi:three-Cys-motif partner protein